MKSIDHPPPGRRHRPDRACHQPTRGAADRAIAHQTRHRSLATLGAYVRIQQAWTDNAATARSTASEAASAFAVAASATATFMSS